MSHVQRSLLEIGKRLLFLEEEGRWATSGQNTKYHFHWQDTCASPASACFAVAPLPMATRPLTRAHLGLQVRNVMLLIKAACMVYLHPWRCEWHLSYSGPSAKLQSQGMSRSPVRLGWWQGLEGEWILTPALD